MKKIKHLMIWIGLLLSLVSCKDTMEAIGLGGDEIPAEGLVLNLQLTNFTKQQIGTRAGTSETFNSLWAVFYGDNNEYLGKADCFSTLSPPQPDGSYKVKITNVPAGTKNVHLVANASDMTESEAQDLQSLTAAKERDPQLDAPICWGEISIDKLLEANPSVPMLRQCAKISLEIDKGIQGNFTNAGLYVYNMATKAAIAPANYTELTTTDDLAESTALRTEDNPLGGGTATTVAVNETSAGKAMVIIKANYKKSEEEDYREGYYKVALYKDSKKTTQYALLRNHHYTIKVIKVNDYGFSTLDEAKKSQPENRLEVEVRDDNPEITRMIACKDYELGVSDYQEVNANTTEATVTIVTTLPKATSSNGKLYDVKINDSWITDWQQETENNIQETSSSSKGKKYTLKLKLEKNNQSENPRPGIITVTSGDLSLDITIKQAGFDFRKDDERRVTMQYNNSTVADNYFSWLDTDVQGITPTDMQGAVRNDGLHFCVGTANITYLIPYLDGDFKINKDSRIKVEKDNGNWKVSLTNTTANEDLWKSSFTIINKAGIKITYPVYHTGIFHKIDESSKAYTDYQLTENGDKVKGLFYYGVVKVEGKKADGTTTTYYMLDRNLGASNNGYYAPDVVALEKNKKAIGGYFYISENKNTSDATQGDLSSVLAPEGYTIPTDAVFEELVNAGNLEVVPQSTSLGETYNCVRIKTVDSELPYIYLPMGGFLEGESHKNPIHVNLWTKTLLSGTQGFSTTSPEYGFWYRYFDVYNKRIGLSNMRFVSGSNGKNNGRYKGMPIRLILSDK